MPVGVAEVAEVAEVARVEAQAQAEAETEAETEVETEAETEVETEVLEVSAISRRCVESRGYVENAWKCRICGIAWLCGCADV